MKDKYNFDDEEFSIDEDKTGKLNIGYLKQETELFDDNSYTPYDLISVRRINLPKNGEDWEILKNKKVILVLKGIRFTKKEKDYLRTVDGIQFIMNGFKCGWNSTSEFKRQIKYVFGKKNNLRRNKKKK